MFNGDMKNASVRSSLTSSIKHIDPKGFISFGNDKGVGGRVGAQVCHTSVTRVLLRLPYSSLIKVTLVSFD